MSNLSTNKTYKRKYFSILTYSQLETGVIEQKMSLTKIGSNRAPTGRCRRCSHSKGPVEKSNLLKLPKKWAVN